MEIDISKNKIELGKKAAAQGEHLINQALSNNGKANIILATGASQFEMLKNLVQADIDWSLISCFHLDEYIGLPEDHPASFRKYLKERFVDQVSPGIFHFINGEQEVVPECNRLNSLISAVTIDVAFVGVGENAHLAFNDPPADFKTKIPFIEVTLDRACREQQLGEGWFTSLEEVPTRAISMSINQILKSTNIICSVPDKRKAKAIEAIVSGEISPKIPASILRKHPNTHLFLDDLSSSLLKL